MKYFNHVILLLLLFSFQSLSAQNTVKMSAVKSNDYGVAYSLPKSVVVVRATITKKNKEGG
ncbi:MAG: hypothetical protein ACLVKO_08100 [Dysgonomonas sp.]